MKTVLFLGPHNATRTQMAEAILRHRAGDLFESCSAGLQPTRLHPMTRHVLAEHGIDASAMRVKDVRHFLGRKTVHYAIILSEPTEANSPRIFPFAIQTLTWPFENPANTGVEERECLSKFRAIRDQIDDQINTWLTSEAEPVMTGEPKLSRLGSC
jgi:arsenate reductase